MNHQPGVRNNEIRTNLSAPVVLARKPSSHPRARWEARVGERSRLEVVLVVDPSSEPTVVIMLTDRELKELLASAPSEATTSWICSECGAANDQARRWCRLCSAHEGGAR